jgi:hypothetical protein
VRTREVAAVLAVALASSSCGAMINGLRGKVSVTSTTPGAEVYLNGGLVGPAPAEFMTGNAGAQVVTVRAPGFATQDVGIGPEVRGLPIVLDVLLAATIIGVAGIISDLLLGTLVRVGPAEVEVNLSPATAPNNAVLDCSFAPGVAQDPADYAP